MGKFIPKEGEVPQHEQVMEIMKTMPGLRLTEIAQFVEFRRESVSARLTQLKREGRVKHEDGKYYPGNGTPQLPAIPPKLRIRKSTKDNLRITELEEEILQLKAWQQSAIAKYPDLGVDPKILAARALAIEYYRRLNDSHKIADIKAGKLDETPLIQVALMAME